MVGALGAGGVSSCGGAGGGLLLTATFSLCLAAELLLLVLATVILPLRLVELGTITIEGGTGAVVGAFFCPGTGMTTVV